MLAEAPRLGPCEVVRAARVAHRRPDSASGSLARRPTRFCWCLCLCLCLCLCALLCSVLRAQCLTPARSYAHTHTHTHALSSSRAVRVAYLLLPLSNDKPVCPPAPARRSTLNAPPVRDQSTQYHLVTPPACFSAVPLSRAPDARHTRIVPRSLCCVVPLFLSLRLRLASAICLCLAPSFRQPILFSRSRAALSDTHAVRGKLAASRSLSLRSSET